MMQGPVIRSVVASLVRGFGQLDAAALEVADHALDPELAFGAGLEAIGKIVGRGKGSYTDEQYRAAIAAQIVINRSTGRDSEFLLVAELTAPTAIWSARSLRPRTFTITTLDPLGVLAVPAADNFKQMTPNATYCAFIHRASDDRPIVAGDANDLTGAAPRYSDANDPDTLDRRFANVVMLNSPNR